MNRFLIPVTATALAAGVAVPTFFGRHTIERVVTEPVQTVVREIYHETPVVYTDTVYMAAEDPTPSQPVYVEEHNDYEYNEYNQCNEYNHTDVDVHQRVIVPPQRRGPGWSPRYREQQPRDRSGYDKPRERKDPPSGSDLPNVPVPKPQVKRTYAPVANDRQSVPIPPIPATPPYQPGQPKRQAPVQGGSAPAASVQPESPKQAPTPKVDKPVAPASDGVVVGMAQATRK